MGSGGSQGAITNANALEYFHRDLQTGLLTGVSSIVRAGTPNPTDSWCICFISLGSDLLSDAILVLYTGYITPENPLTWHGEYEIQGTERVVTGCRSTVALSLYTSVIVKL